MKNGSFRIKSLISICIAMCFLMVVITGCASTMQQRKVSESGFLNDFSQLKEGTDDQALYVYIDESVDFASYTRMIIDPVSIVVSEDSDMAKVSAGDRQKMADYFFAVLNKNLGEDYKIVSSPSAGTMKLRFALTDIKDKNVTMNTISSILPIGIALDAIGLAASGSHSFVGDASAEMELVDSVSGKRIVAAVDSRAGGRYTGDFDFSDWGDVKEACDYWAQQIAMRLDEFSGRK